MRLKVSCLKCKCEISKSNFQRHNTSCTGNYTGTTPVLCECKFCALIFSGFTASEKANHTRWCDSNPKKQEYRSAVSNMSAIIAMNAAKAKSGITNQFTKARSLGQQIFTTAETRKKLSLSGKGRSPSVETRNKLRVARIKFLTENPDKHPWKNKQKHVSKPCEDLKNILLHHDIQFIEEYQPLIDRFFSIDIFIPNKNIGIEVNGNQHYQSNGQLKKYYLDRHDLIESAGIELLEIPYMKVYDTEYIDMICSRVK